MASFYLSVLLAIASESFKCNQICQQLDHNVVIFLSGGPSGLVSPTWQCGNVADPMQPVFPQLLVLGR